MRPVLFILFLSVFTSALSNSTNKKRDASSSMVDINHVIVHDPVMIEENGTYYLFSTGKGISVKSSKDMISWQNEDPVFSEAPEWAVLWAAPCPASPNTGPYRAAALAIPRTWRLFLSLPMPFD